MKPKIIHLTSVHKRYDIRIFYKICISLVKYGYDVVLIVADGKGDENNKGVQIKDVGTPKGSRFLRMTKTVSLIFNKAKDLNADIYHLHDPELIPIGLKLKKLSKKVIFDAHEDFPVQLLSKPYLTKLSRIILSKIFKYYEKWTFPKFDFVVTATPFIRDKILKINRNTTDVNNFPIINKISNENILKRERKNVVYVGEISKIRGIEEMVSALAFTKNIKLNLAGNFSDKDLEKKIKKNAQWAKVNNLGFLSRTGVYELLINSIAGLVVLHPKKNYIDALPVKMFEYMSAGIPVIASNFTMWSEIIEINNCGICVDPTNPEAIAGAIQFLSDNPDQAEQMGRNGLKVVKQKYNWLIEEKKLIKIYRNI